ncbi:hypothetical protein AMS68_004583 [Peltaster fructicola]|uniref:Beta-catenin-like protein 1 N-terminal domain-containing protein n=1 Tax=Peltaster fructicola TaxID=286661 RepID=A0A6H0XWK7_9PEZI|nr:hypothetical protein AMS68_004583 [Peltaster fructicola]
MASVDDLFKRPNVPSGALKRKLEVPDAQDRYKAAKLSSNGSPNGHSNGKATVEDVAESDDTEAGPALPDDDDDEEGRFFGGGVSGDAAQALDYVDRQDDADEYQEEKIDAAWLKRTSTNFARKLVKNAELRSRFEGEPQKFMASEADLDAEVKSWSLLSEHPELFPAFVESGSAEKLVQLLSHENTDIAIGAIEIINELLDEDVQAEQEQWNQLAGALLEADLTELLLSNLARLDEENESDRSGVYYSLAVIESLAGQQTIAERIGTVPLLEWLCVRIQKAEPSVTQNKQYATEVLQVLLQSSSILRSRLAKDLDGVDLYLQLLANYRKRDPVKDSTEEEYAENLFDALTCVIDEEDGKNKFIEAEGMELALIMLREGSFSKIRALRLLDHAAGGKAGAQAVCERLVEAAGLKIVFSLFKKKTDVSTTEHLIGIYASLLRQLPEGSDARIRTINKFLEKDFEKIVRIIQLRSEYARKLTPVDDEIKLERRMMDEEEWPEREDEWYSRRLDGGLFCLQMLDVIIAWLLAEDAGARQRIESLLEKAGLDAVQKSLAEQADDAEDTDTKDMLTALASIVYSPT